MMHTFLKHTAVLSYVKLITIIATAVMNLYTSMYGNVGNSKAYKYVVCMDDDYSLPYTWN